MSQFIRLALPTLLALAACDGDGGGSGGGSSSCGASPAGLMNAASWRAGPIIWGRDYSPSTADPSPRPEGWSIDIPQYGGETDGIFLNHGPLTGKTRITIRYRVEGARIVSSERPDENGVLTLFFQRRGDDWSGSEQFEHYRWYSIAYAELTPGEHEFTASLVDDRWISVWGRQDVSFPQPYRDALANAQCVGIVFGSTSARGHGVYGPARIVVTDFRIE